jgi:hypothetical protein
MMSFRKFGQPYRIILGLPKVEALLKDDPKLVFSKDYQRLKRLH